MKDDDLPVGMMDQPPEVVERFRRIVASGESPRMAEMLALQKAPGGQTDTSHYAGMGIQHLEKSVGKYYTDKITAQAKAAGIAIGPHSVFNGSLADARGGGDPGAWLLAGDGRAKWRDVARSRGMASEELGVAPGESAKRIEVAAKTKERFNKRKAERAAARKEVKALQKV